MCSHREANAESQPVNDEKYGGSLIPITARYHEHDEDPEMGPEAITPDKREQVIAHMGSRVDERLRIFSESAGGRPWRP